MSRWIELEGAVNVRDLGGLPTTGGGAIRRGALLRSDNLQDLTSADIEVLIADIGLRNIIDLRSEAEVTLVGPGPLTGHAAVTIHHLSLFTEGGHYTDADAAGIDADKVLPWQGSDDTGPESDRSVGHYLGYITDRPDSVVAALRVIPAGPSIVHCAAGKDRTGVVVAFALHVAGVPREEIIADYARTGERLEAILARLRSSPVYAEDLDSRPADSHVPHARTMDRFLSVVDQRFGGPLGWLREHGWTRRDTDDLRAALAD